MLTSIRENEDVGISVVAAISVARAAFHSNVQSDLSLGLSEIAFQHSELD